MYVIYMVLLVCVCSLYTVIPASPVVGPTGIPSGRRNGTRRMFGDPNWVLPIGICSKGAEQIYPVGRLPKHPPRSLGAAGHDKMSG